MQIAIIIILCIYFLYVLTKDTHKAVYMFLPFNYIYDLVFYSIDSSSTLILNLIRFFIIIFFYFKLRRSSKSISFQNKPAYIYFILLISILSISTIFEFQNIKGITETIKFILIIYSFYAFYTYFSRNNFNLIKFKEMAFSLLIITLVNIIISNIFKLGWAGYSEEVGFYTGGIVSNMWYIPSLTITISMALILIKKQKLLFIVLTFLVVGIIIIAFRRSAYVILGISGIGIILFYRIGVQSIRFIIIIGIAVIFVLPEFNSLFDKQFDARTKTFDKGLNEESRLKESINLWEERFEQKSLKLLFFGEKPFNSVENYGNGEFGDRPLHVDINIIFFSSGLVGIILYALFYLKVFSKFLFFKKRVRRRISNRNLVHLNYLFVSSFFSIIAMSFSGGLNAITFRIFGFFLLGMTLGQYNNYYHKIHEKIK